MSGPTTTKTLKVQIDNFVFYRTSDVGILLGKLSEPLFSNDKIFLEVGTDCKIKFKLDCPNLSLNNLASAGSVDFIVRNTCERKFLRGSPVHQFTAEAIEKYHEDDKRETFSF